MLARQRSRRHYWLFTATPATAFTMEKLNFHADQINIARKHPPPVFPFSLFSSLSSGSGNHVRIFHFAVFLNNNSIEINFLNNNSIEINFSQQQWHGDEFFSTTIAWRRIFLNNNSMEINFSRQQQHGDKFFSTTIAWR